MRGRKEEEEWEGEDTGRRVKEGRRSGEGRRGGGGGEVEGRKG